MLNKKVEIYYTQLTKNRFNFFFAGSYDTFIIYILYLTTNICNVINFAILIIFFEKILINFYSNSVEFSCLYK